MAANTAKMPDKQFYRAFHPLLRIGSGATLLFIAGNPTRIICFGHLYTLCLRLKTGKFYTKPPEKFYFCAKGTAPQ
ncbi:hypothetical protein C7N43_15050 [Sphingobacteriales bacterium UPWRP_1]|nr:hypothetical protein BVG80_04915 [Sphingobacteriales bacterium TSM_CSM]PSJ76227.1 hypothetical protein C7N43_15050 [Sphingobacteriales bacterium UPWRP_1]